MKIELTEPLKRHFANPASKADLILKQIESGMYDKYIPFIQDKVVLDVGANIGLFSLWASQFAEHVYSVEPTKDHFYLLQENIVVNNKTNITPLNYALSPTRGELLFYLNRGNSTMNSLIPYGDNFTQYIVQAVTLNDLLEDYPKVDFLKMDIEGSESLLFDNNNFFISLNKIKSFFIEVHSLKIIGHLPELDLIRKNWMTKITDKTEARFTLSEEGPDGIAGYINRV